MAITKIHAIKSTLGKALDYIENPDKTDGQMLVSGYNCEPQTASIDFEMTAVLAHKARNLKRKRSTNLAYHLIQSFSPEDAVTPEQAHELGKKLAFEYTGGKYEYVVATHIDKGHIHNHIMINAVSFYDYKKLRTVPYRTARQIRDISDRLCMEAHLSVIDVDGGRNVTIVFGAGTGEETSRTLTVDANTTIGLIGSNDEVLYADIEGKELLSVVEPGTEDVTVYALPDTSDKGVSAG